MQWLTSDYSPPSLIRESVVRVVGGAVVELEGKVVDGVEVGPTTNSFHYSTTIDYM